MHLIKPLALLLLAISMLFGACAGRPASANPTASVASEKQSAAIPVFSGDSAYAAVAAQVDMGPRYPGSDAAEECAVWIKEQLNKYGADTVIVQHDMVPDPMNTSRRVPLNNILGRFNTQAKNRIMLVAHYDTRPIADEESDPTLAAKPIPGANDGGSGVGVMIELARLMSLKRPDAGVDLLFVDLEDSGTTHEDDTWCIGSQYFASHLPFTSAADRPRAAIVLDMVGAPGARFHRELFSDHYNRGLVDRVWGAARVAGYASRFPDEAGGAILDDHLPLIRAGIPTIDIVENRAEATGSFPAAWHTHADDMTNIDRATLEAVGRTMAQVIYTYR